MSEQESFGSTPKDSQHHITHLYNQQLQISKAFQPTNFYLNERFNLKELKQKIEYRKQQQYLQTTLKANHNLIQPKQYHLSPQEHSPPSSIHPQPHPPSYSSAKQTIKEPQKRIFDRTNTRNYHMTSSKRRLTENKQQKNYILINKEARSYDHSARHQTLNQHRYRRVESTNKQPAQPSSHQKPIKQQYFNQPPKNSTLIHKQRQLSTLFRQQRSITPFYQPLERKIISRLVKTKTEGEESRFSGVQTQNSFNSSMEGKIPVSNNTELAQLQTKIMVLWQHYELLSRILEIIQRDSEKTKLHINKYRETVCGNTLEFIAEMVHLLCSDASSKRQESFFKRFKKGIVVSRLYQHLSIIFLALSFYSPFPATHLSNMIGYASSNLSHTIKLLLLCHYIQAPLKLASCIEEKILVISSFEVGSYKKELTRVAEVLMRIQQNNNVMAVIKNKLQFKKEFASYLNEYLRINEPDLHPLKEYSRYIFEYFAFTIVNHGQFGVLQSMEMAPSPYLTLHKPRTVVIQPWHVLLSMKGEATFVRAYSQQFLTEISQHCNIVYWTDLLPDQINTLLEKMPPGYILYRYHCKYQNGNFVKLLARLGSDLDNTIIIDRSQANFRCDKEMGIELPWSGRRRDSKLLNFLQTLQYIFEEKTTFKEGFAQIKSNLIAKNTAYKDRLQKSYGVIRHNYGQRLRNKKY